MSRIVYGTPSAFVEVDDALEKTIRDTIERVAPGVVDTMDATTYEIWQGAKAQWPVGPYKEHRNGRHSRDELYRDILVSADGTVRGRVWCTAEWARYIKPKGLGGKSAFVELLRKPTERMKPRLVEAIRNLVVNSFEESRRG